MSNIAELLSSPPNTKRKSFVYTFYFQTIYNDEMTNQSEGVRAEVTFKTARRAMAHARKKSIPTGPSTIEEVIGGFEAGTYPPLYQGMYVGSVHNDTTGKFI